MWVQWDGERVDLVSLAPARGTRPEQLLLPRDAELLMQLGRIALGSSRARLYAARPSWDFLLRAFRLPDAECIAFLNALGNAFSALIKDQEGTGAASRSTRPVTPG